MSRAQIADSPNQMLRQQVSWYYDLSLDMMYLIWRVNSSNIYRVSGIEFRHPVSDVKYQVMSIMYRLIDIELQMSSTASINYQISGPRYTLVSDIRNKTSNIKYQVSHVSAIK